MTLLTEIDASYKKKTNEIVKMPFRVPTENQEILLEHDFNYPTVSWS